MALTVERLCNQLARLKLVEPAMVRDLRQRWLKKANDDKDNANAFGKWLVAQKKISDFQWTLLSKGEGEQLYFGAYKLIERIGQGRMAGVFKAVHKLGQTVAIKVLPPSKANHPQLLARFLREARLATRLNHPNVVRAFHQGKSNTGLHYIVMEFLDGVSFDEILKKRQRISVREAVYVAAQALDGLQHIFEEGMIHRDMKPANLMFLPAANDRRKNQILKGTIKILDIGLGRALFDEGAPEAAVSELTADGAILGTPSYMAPEQARNPRTVDIRADIYSMGCVLYHMLTGAPPFDDPQFMRQIARHVAEPPALLREKVTDIPQELQDVVDIMLAKDPAQRYSTPERAAKALRTVLSAEDKPPAAAKPDEAMESYLTWLRESPGGAEASGAAGEDSGRVKRPSAPVPAAGPIATAVAPPPAKGQPIAPPVAKPAAAKPSGDGKRPEPSAKTWNLGHITKHARELWRKLALHPRDFLFLGIGAALVLAMEILLWGIWTVFNWVFGG